MEDLIEIIRLMSWCDLLSGASIAFFKCIQKKVFRLICVCHHCVWLFMVRDSSPLYRQQFMTVIAIFIVYVFIKNLEKKLPFDWTAFVDDLFSSSIAWYVFINVWLNICSSFVPKTQYFIRNQKLIFFWETKNFNTKYSILTYFKGTTKVDMIQVLNWKMNWAKWN